MGSRVPLDIVAFFCRARTVLPLLLRLSLLLFALPAVSTYSGSSSGSSSSASPVSSSVTPIVEVRFSSIRWNASQKLYVVCMSYTVNPANATSSTVVKMKIPVGKSNYATPEHFSNSDCLPTVFHKTKNRQRRTDPDCDAEFETPIPMRIEWHVTTSLTMSNGTTTNVTSVAVARLEDFEGSRTSADSSSSLSGGDNFSSSLSSLGATSGGGDTTGSTGSTSWHTFNVRLAFRRSVEEMNAKRVELKEALASVFAVESQHISIHAIVAGSAVVYFSVWTRDDVNAVQKTLSSAVTDPSSPLHSFGPMEDTVSVSSQDQSPSFSIGVPFYIGLAILVAAALAGAAWACYRRSHPDLRIKSRPTCAVRGGTIVVGVTSDKAPLHERHQHGDIREQLTAFRYKPEEDPDDEEFLTLANTVSFSSAQQGQGTVQWQGGSKNPWTSSASRSLSTSMSTPQATSTTTLVGQNGSSGVMNRSGSGSPLPRFPSRAVDDEEEDGEYRPPPTASTEEELRPQQRPSVLIPFHRSSDELSSSVMQPPVPVATIGQGRGGTDDSCSTESSSGVGGGLLRSDSNARIRMNVIESRKVSGIVEPTFESTDIATRIAQSCPGSSIATATTAAVMAASVESAQSHRGSHRRLSRPTKVRSSLTPSMTSPQVGSLSPGSTFGDSLHPLDSPPLGALSASPTLRSPRSPRIPRSPRRSPSSVLDGSSVGNTAVTVVVNGAGSEGPLSVPPSINGNGTARPLSPPFAGTPASESFASSSALLAPTSPSSGSTSATDRRHSSLALAHLQPSREVVGGDLEAGYAIE